MAGTLYVKYDASDTGARVPHNDPIPPGVAYYVTPSIWLTDDAGNSLTQAKVDQVNWIHVQVDSISADPRAGVRAQVWVCNFTAGIGPDSARPSSGGKPGRWGGVPQGQLVTQTVPGIVKVPWTPQVTDLINTSDPNQGHLCVAANVFVEPPP